MRRLLLAFGCVLAGCSRPGPAGTYVATNGLHIVLNSDHSYRIMNGERTSPADVTGTYVIGNGKLQLTPQGSHGKAEADFKGDSFTLGVQTFKKQ